MALITLIICMCCLAYGATIFFNSYLDKTTAQIFSVTVKDKYTSSGRRNRYYLNVEAWGRYTSAENIPVSSKLYKAENIGDTVNIYLKKGRLGIPWFWVEGNR